jgi:MFS family permease
MMLPQSSELIIMATLGASLPRLGVKRAFVIGFLAWSVRYALFAVSPEIGFAMSGLFLHGVCFTFVFAVASLYVNEVAPAAIRASAQALVTIGLFGFGRFLGSFFAGYAQKLVTHPLAHPIQIGGTTYKQQTNWEVLFAIPLVITAVAAVLMMVLFKEPHSREPEPVSA